MLNAILLSWTCGISIMMTAQQIPRVLHTFKTPLGVIKEVEDCIRPHIYGDMYITLNDKPILKGKASDGTPVGLMSEDFQTIEQEKKEEIYTRLMYREVFPAGGTAGWEKYYIIDLTGKEPIVSPGFDNGDLTYVQKTVWGKDKVTIYFKDKGKIFVWENFKLKEVPRKKK